MAQMYMNGERMTSGDVRRLGGGSGYVRGSGRGASFRSTSQMARDYGLGRAGRPKYTYLDELGGFANKFPTDAARGLDSAFAMRFAGAKALLMSLQAMAGWGALPVGPKQWNLPSFPPGWCQDKPRQAGPCAGAAPENVYEGWRFFIDAGPAATCGSEACPQFVATVGRPLPIDYSVIGVWPFNAVGITLWHDVGGGVAQEVATFRYPASTTAPTQVPQYGPKTRVMPVADPFSSASPMAVSYGKPAAAGVPLKPYERPAPISIEFPGGGKPPRPGPPTHILQPPGPREKEEKRSFPGRSIAATYGFATEVQDAVSCLKKNIKYPKGTRYGSSRQPRSAGGLSNDLAWLSDAVSRGYLDYTGFAECFMANQATDFIIGSIGGATARNFNRSPYNMRRGLGLGFTAGGFSARMR